MLPELTAAALPGGSAGSSSELQPNTSGVSASSPPSSCVGADCTDTAFFTVDESSERATTAGKSAPDIEVGNRTKIRASGSRD